MPIETGAAGAAGASGGGGGGGDATASNQVLGLTALDSIYDALQPIGTEATSAQILSAVQGLSDGATLADLAAALTPLASAATEATQADVLAALQAQGVDIGLIQASVATLVTNTDGLETLLGAIQAGTDKIPSSPAQDRTTAAAPSAIRASNGTSFIDVALDATVQAVTAAVNAAKGVLDTIYTRQSDGSQKTKVTDGTNDAAVVNSTPSTEYGVVTRNIPSGIQAVSGSVTATISGTPAVDTELPTAGALGDSMTNPTTPLIGAAQVGYTSGGVWKRILAFTGTDQGAMPDGVVAIGGKASGVGTLRALLTDISNRLIVVGAGTAGTPTGGVLTVQGASGATAVPVTSAATELAPSIVRSSSEDGFGRPVFVEPTPVLQASFANGVTFDIWRTYATGTGTATTTAQTDGLATVSTGATGSSIVELVSSDTFSYRAGQSLRLELTTLFSAPASGGFQAVGVGPLDGFAIGYNGTAFGFLVRRGGVPEIRTLTITTASTTNENITVTLNGVGTSVAVTNNGSTVTTARQIAAGDYSASGLGWDAYQKGSTVIFVAKQPGSLSGSYSLTATTAIGSFAQDLAGVTPTDTWIAKSAWNGDRLDNSQGANNLSGATLDPTKLSVWQVVIPYLGAGAITLQWQDPTSKRWTTCHTVAPANTATTTTVRNPVFRLWIRASGAANISASSGSLGLFCDGKVESNGQQINVPASFKTTVGNASELPLVSIRTERIYNGAENRWPFRFFELSTSAGATGQVIIRSYLNATLTGANFGAVNAFGHPLAYDTSTTAASGGLPVGSAITSPSGGSTPIDLTKLGYVLQPGDVVTFTAQQTSGTNGTVAIAFTGKLDSGSGGI